MNKQVPISELVPIFKEILNSGSNVNFTPRGVSMLPMLRDNCDTVTLSKPTKLKKYDVVFFYHKPTNSYVLHRIVKVNSDGTYNICGIASMGKACEINNFNIDDDMCLYNLKSHMIDFINNNITRIVKIFILPF